MTHEEMCAEVVRNGERLVTLVWLVAILSALYVLGKATTILITWRERGEISQLLKVNKDFIEVAEWQRKQSREQFKSEVGDVMEERAKEGVRKGIVELSAHPVASPSESGDQFPTIPPLPAGGVVVPLPPAGDKP